ncbi:hypothetical protein H072_1948 [Dactylellina haptotyla CBS 200.50]|uniref:Uncharacterized protein n=1 Tax=Dactylellina haptotyla (strain CBS 200.50) TaxID=1284197 RepID=S8AMA9_DACHA|nr:hypothetical protein H072_1948 [Dactylellina haptotyla CBS 200.50]
MKGLILQYLRRQLGTWPTPRELLLSFLFGVSLSWLVIYVDTLKSSRERQRHVRYQTHQPGPFIQVHPLVDAIFQPGVTKVPIWETAFADTLLLLEDGDKVPLKGRLEIWADADDGGGTGEPPPPLPFEINITGFRRSPQLSQRRPVRRIPPQRYSNLDPHYVRFASVASLLPYLRHIDTSTSQDQSASTGTRAWYCA